MAEVSHASIPAAEQARVARTAARRPLIAHVIYRLAVGGLENGLVNLINRLPEYRHAVLCMTDYTDFRERITHPDTSVHALHKQPGQDVAVYLRLWKLLRRLRPEIVHTRNLSALEAQLPAWLAGVRRRVHSEHGRDYPDVDGTLRRYQLLRRAYSPLIQTFIPLSQELESYLADKVGVPRAKLARIYNGVDLARFDTAAQDRDAVLPPGFAPPGAVILGAVGRMQKIKDQTNLVRAFLALLEREPARRAWLRLVLVGDGPLKAEAERLLARGGALDLAWLPGERNDVPALMRALDVFVLPSLNEGISNTILEAMACALPVVATSVGGNPELVEDGVTGALAPPADSQALADALLPYISDAALRADHGANARRCAQERFSIEAMVGRYRKIYERLLQAPSPCPSPANGRGDEY